VIVLPAAFAVGFVPSVATAAVAVASTAPLAVDVPMQDFKQLLPNFFKCFC
jgi:hypothetical protein